MDVLQCELFGYVIPSHFFARMQHLEIEMKCYLLLKNSSKHMIEFFFSVHILRSQNIYEIFSYRIVHKQTVFLPYELFDALPYFLFGKMLFHNSRMYVAYTPNERADGHPSWHVG